MKHRLVVAGKGKEYSKRSARPQKYERNAVLCSIYSSHAQTRLVRFIDKIDIICVFNITGLYN